nr:MAG TPA: hypothetical protein [Caudoviricetes sp.]
MACELFISRKLICKPFNTQGSPYPAPFTSGG